MAILYSTRIVLDTADGVMLADNPVISTKEVLVVVKESTLVTDTTCNTFPPPPPDGVNVHTFDAVRTRLPPFDVSRVSGVPLIVTPAAGVIVTVPTPRFKKLS